MVKKSYLSLTKLCYNLKKLILLSLIFILSGKFYAQNDTINQTDAEGKKQGYWIYYGKDKPESGYPPEGKIDEGTFVNDRKEGIWKYNCHNEIIFEGLYKDEEKWEGKEYVYDKDGILIKVKIWKNGEYHSDGQL